ncbi:MAG: glycosyltransferase [Lachnospiraceae bacterium]|nr:glycosyltransferase [Lachnospiraceae bacterium]
MDKISVVIPAYNAENFIENAVNSVLSQTHREVEVLIVNDGSGDRTKEICERLEKQHTQVRFIDKPNTGVSDTRNTALWNLTGEYVFFLDADDLLPEYALELLLGEIKRESCKAVYGTHAYRYPDGKLLPRSARIMSGVYTFEDIKDRFLDDGTLTGILFGSACGVLYRTDILRENRILFPVGVAANEDGIFNLYFLSCADRFCVLDSPYVYLYNQWKNKVKQPLDIDRRLAKADEVLLESLARLGLKEEFASQLLRRRATVAFVHAVRIAGARTNLIQSRRYLKSLFNAQGVQEGLQEMDYEHMSRYKRMICMMMRRRMYVLFYLVIRYIYPLAGKVIKR